jgi:hypothetical protein
VIAALYFCHAGLAYLLMLAAMTYNTGAFFAIVAGLAFGHWFFTLQAFGLIPKPKQTRSGVEEKDG